MAPIPTPATPYPASTGRVEELHDIDVVTSASHLLIVADRWGQAVAVEEEVVARGADPAAIEDIVASHPECFADQCTFLVAVQPGSRLAAPLGSSRFGFLVEFEISDEWLPQSGMVWKKEAAAWRDTLANFAPDFLALGRCLQGLPPETAGGIRCFFDLDGYYGGSICALLPLEAAVHHTTIRETLFDSRRLFPPSAHARIAAHRRIRWRFDPREVSADRLPTNSIPV